MNPWAADRVRQLDTDAITAFGIRLISRHAQAWEMIELLDFALAATAADVNLFVPEVFYDSGSGCCSFKLSPALDGAGDAARQEVFDCARQTISQFLWQGRVHHGRDIAGRAAPP
jgi:hypothetical protein